jgi:hypothetical protein
MLQLTTHNAVRLQNLLFYKCLFWGNRNKLILFKNHTV